MKVRQIDRVVAELMGYTDFWQDRQTSLWYAHLPGPIHIEDDRMPIPRPSQCDTDGMDLWRWLHKEYNYVTVGTKQGKDVYEAAIIPGDGAVYKGEAITLGWALAKCLLSSKGVTLEEEPGDPVK